MSNFGETSSSYNTERIKWLSYDEEPPLHLRFRTKKRMSNVEGRYYITDKLITTYSKIPIGIMDYTLNYLAHRIMDTYGRGAVLITKAGSSKNIPLKYYSYKNNETIKDSLDL